MSITAKKHHFPALLFFALVLMPVTSYSQFITNIVLAPQPRLSIVSPLGISNRVEYSSELASNNWLILTNVLVSQSPYQVLDQGALPATKRFYRALDPVAPSNMAPVSAGSFLIGDLLDGYAPCGGYCYFDAPTQTVSVAAFYIDRFEVTKAFWDDVYQWAIAHGYGFEFGAAGKSTNHPAQNMTWYDAVKWCNARSEREGRVPAYYTDSGQTNVFRTGQTNVSNASVKWNAGYRLPTETEWEKAAQGGAGSHRFAWSASDSITHGQANYYSATNFSYDVSVTHGYHPAFVNGLEPYTSPVGSFASNGYGLYDMTGNVREWTWDWYNLDTFYNNVGSDPRGPGTGTSRVNRGGSWNQGAVSGRTPFRGSNLPTIRSSNLGFRCALPATQL